MTPGLGTLLVGDDPGSHAYVRGKHRDCAKVGIASIQRELPADATQADVERAIDELNADPACTGFIVQLPLPRGLDEGAALERIDPAKDADGLHPVSLGRLVLGEEAPLPCTPARDRRAVRRYGVRAGRGARSRWSAAASPSAARWACCSPGAARTPPSRSCHTGTRDLAAEVRRADIVVAAAGVPGWSPPTWSRRAPPCSTSASRAPSRARRRRRARGGGGRRLLAPMPGGVGPMTRAMLLTNVVEAAERSLP